MVYVGFAQARLNKICGIIDLVLVQHSDNCNNKSHCPAATLQREPVSPTPSPSPTSATADEDVGTYEIIMCVNQHISAVLGAFVGIICC